MTSDSPTVRAALSEPPGGVLMWLIVALELLTFGILFVMIALLRTDQAAVFSEGQGALSPGFGLGLTVVLITSGSFAAEAVHAARAGLPSRARALFGAAIAGGVGFVVLKVIDTSNHFAAGHRLGVNDFWDAYFLSTGFHFMHVLVGLTLLIVFGPRVGREGGPELETIAGAALFWHLCDLAWFFLFPLLYVRA